MERIGLAVEDLEREFNSLREVREQREQGLAQAKGEAEKFNERFQELKGNKFPSILLHSQVSFILLFVFLHSSSSGFPESRPASRTPGPKGKQPEKLRSNYSRCPPSNRKKEKRVSFEGGGASGEICDLDGDEVVGGYECYYWGNASKLHCSGFP